MSGFFQRTDVAPQPREGELPLVAAVIPAYNAVDTIGETLRSICEQTWPALEIIVVDDGSTDGTSALVERRAGHDARIQLVRQANGGVARARNRGIAQAKAEFVAPIDADDLWAPDKIEKQMAAIVAGGPDIGLVYCWFCPIDEASCVIERPPFPSYAGDVLNQLARVNFIGNGSSALMRKAAVLEVGGYDPRLRDAGAQGCEDTDLYLRLAMRYGFGVVPEHLVGYRDTTGNMSSDAAGMLRSWRMVSEALAAERPDLAPLFKENEREILLWLYRRCADAHRPVRALQIIRAAAAAHPGLALSMLREAAGRTRRYVRSSIMGRPPRAPRPSFLADYSSSALAAAADIPR